MRGRATLALLAVLAVLLAPAASAAGTSPPLRAGQRLVDTAGALSPSQLEDVRARPAAGSPAAGAPAGVVGRRGETWRRMVRCMNRTNIYLEPRQTEALDELARLDGVARAEVVRRLIDEGLTERRGRLERDLRAIRESFGALADDGDDDRFERGPSERDAHLARMWGR